MRVQGLIFFLILISVWCQAQVNCPQNLPLTLSGNTDYCIGSSGSQLSVSESYAGYEWLPTTETGQSVLLTAGSYEVVVTHYTGCTDTLEFEVQQVSNPPQPTIQASGPTEFCEGGSVTLTVPTWYPYYEWNTGSISDEITVFESGTFLVSVEDWIGCESSSNLVQVIVNPLPEALFSPNLNMFDIEFDNLSLYATDYQWNFGDGNFSTDFEPIYTYTANGTQSMWLVASNDCGTDTAFLDLMSVGIEEANVFSDFSVYPNPTTGVVNLSLESAMTPIADATVIISDASSRQLLTLTRTIKPGINKIALTLSDLADGIYFLSIVTHDSKMVRPIFLSR
jgi:PKD repeat protein